MSNQEQSVDNIILNRLANEIGTLKARVIQVETYNEFLIEHCKELEAKLEPAEELGSSEDEAIKTE